MDAAEITMEAMVDGFHRMQVEHARVAQHIAVQHELNPADLRVLKYMGSVPTDANPATPGTVGTYLEMSRGAITALLDRLETRGLLQRSPNPRDRRGQHLTLTPDGIQVIGRLRDAYARAIQASIPDDLRVAFLHGCASLARELDAQVAADIAQRKTSG